MSFSSLGLCAPILKAVSEKGYTALTPIQEQAIPAVLSGRDVMAAAQTGTGKTAGFVLPLLEKLRHGKGANSGQARALILTPTRELAAQVAESVQTYGKHLSLKSAVVFGGVGIHPQKARLNRGVDVLVATPGRLLDLYNQGAVRFNDLSVLVLDEADRMLDMGFIHDIKKIIALLPKQRQNLMFSATFSNEIRSLAKGIINKPVEISVSPANSATPLVKQWLCPVDKKQKSALLAHLIRENSWYQVLVFSRTKHGANRLATYLEKSSISAAAIHGNKSQGARTRALADFKSGKVQILVATDIAARGLDIDQLPCVVNFDLPNVPEDYVHRIGRTGRAGSTGNAISLVSADEQKQLKDIERLIKKTIKRETVSGFVPDHSVPDTPEIRKTPSKPRGNRPRQAASGEKTAKPNGSRRRPRNRNSNSGNRTQASA
jgi:ATP-dependent RNA helicase RhlE